MSAVTFEWTPAEIVAPPLASKRPSETPCREREFQHALERYAAGYAAHQTNRTGVIGNGVDTGGLPWLCTLRRLLTAIDEVRLFSRQVCGDWRLPYGNQDW